MFNAFAAIRDERATTPGPNNPGCEGSAMDGTSAGTIYVFSRPRVSITRARFALQEVCYAPVVSLPRPSYPSHCCQRFDAHGKQPARLSRSSPDPFFAETRPEPCHP